MAILRAAGVAKTRSPGAPILEGWVMALAGVSGVPTAVRGAGVVKGPDEATEG